MAVKKRPLAKRPAIKARKAPAVPVMDQGPATAKFDYEADADSMGAPGQNALLNITGLVDLALQYQGELAEMAAKMKDKQGQLDRIIENTLPDAMVAANTSNLGLLNGGSVKIEEGLSVSLPKSKLADICKWLRANKLRGLIKQEVIIMDLKGKPPLEVKKKLAALGVKAAIAENVNTASAKAMLQQRMRDSKAVNLPLFGAFPWRKAIIKVGAKQ